MQTTAEKNKFVLETEKLIITDPCYDVGTWCTATVDAQPGEWTFRVVTTDDDSVRDSTTGKAYKRVVRLEAQHSSVTIFKPTQQLMEEIGVDSGQAGFFELAKYRKDAYIDTSRISPKWRSMYERSRKPDGEGFYAICCEQSMGQYAGPNNIPFGCVSASGYGDGGYTAFVQRNDANKVVAISLVFIDENRSEEDWDLDLED